MESIAPLQQVLVILYILAAMGGIVYVVLRIVHALIQVVAALIELGRNRDQ